MANFGAALAVRGAGGELHRCVARKRLGLVVCGDRVTVQRAPTGDCVVIEREPRATLLARPDRRGRAKPLAANFDRLLVVVAPRPPPQPSLLDRYLVLAAHLGVEPILVLHKDDMPDSAGAAFAGLAPLYAGLDYSLCRTSARRAGGLDPLTMALRGHTGILVGQSGVGKSSIVARLIPDRSIQVGALSQASGLGRHTTTVAMLYVLPGGGALIDSPGIREFPLTGLNGGDVRAGFREFAPLAERCRFGDCSHLREPGCAVLAALGNRVDRRRWDSYRTIMESL